jgi:flavin reductase (DIM6/NTAB) family NADH-FMN oxidoreductase RutF
MHYDTDQRDHGLPHDPFKALVVPRPIGWVSTLDKEGRANLAPYSFFNAVSDRPPMLMFSSGGTKDSLRNILDTGEFTCSIATWALREPMNLSSAPVAPGVDEFRIAGLTKAVSRRVGPPRVAESPAAFECKLWQVLPLPPAKPGGPPAYTMVLGTVVAVYIDDAFIHDGRVDSAAMRPLARLGYMDYSSYGPEQVFQMDRPLASEDGQRAVLPTGLWDGVYR